MSAALLARIERLETRAIAMRKAVQSVLANSMMGEHVRGELENALTDAESLSLRLQVAYFNAEDAEDAVAMREP